MPLYDLECSVCGKVIENVLQKFDDLLPSCDGSTDGVYTDEHGNDYRHDPVPMVRLIGPVTFRKLGKGWPDQDNKELKARFERRNKRIEKMTPEQQDVIKKIIDKPGAFGKRYIP